MLGLAAVALVSWLALPQDAATPPAPSPARPQPQPAAPDRQAAAPVREPVAAAAPAVAVDAYGELTESAWTVLPREVPAGALEVMVLRGDRPVGNARIRLWPQAAAGRMPGDATVPASYEARSDAEGRATVRGLEPGDWVARADVGGDHVLLAHLPVDAQHASRTVLLLLGTAVIRGRACDAHGMALVDVPVWISGIGPQPHRGAVVATAADGRFEVGGLIAGRYNVQLQMPEWHAEQERLLTLSSGEQAEVLFGRALPLLPWHGRLRDASGELLPGRRGLYLRHLQRNDERRLFTAETGSIEAQLPEGHWQVWLASGASHDGLFHGDELGEIVVDETGLPQELRWRTLRIIGLLFPDDASGFDAKRATAALRLSGVGPRETAPEGPFVVAAQPIVQWLLSTPGQYRIRGDRGTAISSSADGSVQVTLSTQQPVVRVPLHLRQARR